MNKLYCLNYKTHLTRILFLRREAHQESSQWQANEVSAASGTDRKEIRALTGRNTFLNKINLEYLSPLTGLIMFISHYPEAALRFTSLATGYFLFAASRQKTYLPRRSYRVFLLFVFCLLTFVSSCKKTTTTQNKPLKLQYQTTGNEGKIKGTVNFVGNTHAPGKIDMNADAACAAKNPNATVETLKVTNGKLANVLVYVKEGTTSDGKKFNDLGFQTPDSEAKLDQLGCVYVPRVLGIRTQQKLSIHNSDQTIHTTQASSVKNPSWFTTQQINSAPVVKTFTEPEVMIPLKCSQHGWMAAFVAVFDHPFFAVTKEDGAFEINGLPAGNYTLAAWHERGTPKGTEKLMQVSVKENGEMMADFSFDETSTQVAPGSMIFSAPLELAMPDCK